MYKWRKLLARLSFFSLIYFILAMLSLETRDPWSLSSSVWLPSGLILGVLCLSPRVFWPLWGLSSGLLHIIASLLYGRSLDIALIFAVVDLATIFPLAIFWRNASHYFIQDSFLSGTLLILMAIYMASVAGGVACVSILSIIGYPIILSHFFTWSLSNATGCLAGTACFILWRYSKEIHRSHSWPPLALMLVVTVIFLLPEPLIRSPLLEQSLIYSSLAGTLMSSILLPQRTLAVYFSYLTLLVTLTTLCGYGPLAGNEVQDMQLSQLYLLAVLSLGLILAAYKKETVIHTEKLQQQLNLICNILEKKEPVFFQLSSDGKECRWSANHSVFGISPLQIPTLLLLQARIHPKDMEAFTHLLMGTSVTRAQPQQCFVQLLLSDHQYHTVHCSIFSAHPLFGVLGVFMLTDDKTKEIPCGDVS